MLKIKVVFSFVVAAIALYLDSQSMIAHTVAKSVLGLSVGFTVIEITKHLAKQKRN